MAVPLTLKVFKGESMVASRDYDRDIIKIGRLSSAHLCLDDEKVSRIHSVIEVGPDGKLSIIDMGSVEGTYVNGKRVNKGGIVFGDEIRVGNTTIRVESATAAAAANLASAAEFSKEPTTQVHRAVTPAADAAVALAQAAHVAASTPVQAPAPEVMAPVVAQPTVAPATARNGVPQAGHALDSSLAATEQNPLVQASAAAHRRPPRKKGKGPLGLELRFMWGDRMVGEFFLQPGKKSAFSVGTAPGVGFLMGDSKLGGPKFDVVTSDGQSFALRFTGKMNGELQRKGETLELKQVIETGKATHEGDSYALALESDDFAWVDLGNVTLEVMAQPVPKPALVPFLETVDFTALNVFLLMFFLGALFVVTALNREAERDPLADELNDNNQAMAKLLIKPPEDKQNAFLKQLAEMKSKKPEAPAAHSGLDGQMGKNDAAKTSKRAAPKAIDKNSKDQARMMVSKIFGKGGGGLSTLFGKAGLGGELTAAMGNMTGKTVGDAFGTGGLGLHGSGGGGGGTGNTIGIGAVGTRGVAGGNSGYGTGAGIMGKKSATDIGITSSTPEVMGSLDPELIRRVIRSHVDQIRYCYEEELQGHPKLNGKVAIKFIITGSGSVATSSVSQSTVGNPRLEQCISGRVRTWLFPKPKGGGTVVVTYPFVLKQSGE